MKGTGIKTSVASIIDYVSYARDACILFSLDNYTSKFVEKETVKKHYFVDNGLLNIFLTDGESSLLENLCAIHLYKKYGKNLYFYNKNVEVDFFVADEAYAIQVSFSLTKDSTRNREVEALRKLHSFFPLKRMVIVTNDEEEFIQLDESHQIEVIPAWKWLLE